MTTDAMNDAADLIDSYGGSGPLCRLAMLASPACKIEPQLLRRLRLQCLDEADVSVEQELWFSELVAARGRAITFAADIKHVLQIRLAAWREREPARILRARTTMQEVHAELPSSLQLEDDLAWAHVFGDDAALSTYAETIMASLDAGRDGLNHWLARAWTSLPTPMKALPVGLQLAEVAAAHGAPVDELPPGHDPSPVAHLLPEVPLLLRRDGAVLTVNAPPTTATHAINVPDSSAVSLEIATASTTVTVVVEPGPLEIPSVGLGPVRVRTAAGKVYELASLATQSFFDIELLPAGHGTSIVLRYGDESGGHRIIVDGGPRSADHLLQKLDTDTVTDELLVVTHADDESIAGIIDLLTDPDLGFEPNDIWFNDTSVAAVPEEAR